MALDYLEPELQRLRAEVLALGRTVENGVSDSVRLLLGRANGTPEWNLGSTEPLITLDHQVTKGRFAIEMDCIALIVTHQIDDDEMRAITSMLEIVSELEWISRYVTDIAKTVLMLARLDDPLLELLNRVYYMAERVRGMMAQGLDAMELQDVDLARDVHRSDGEIDDLYLGLYCHSLEFIKSGSRAQIKQARHLGQIARNLERTADRVTNICEWVVFSAVGQLNAIDTEPVAAVGQEMIG